MFRVDHADDIPQPEPKKALPEPFKEWNCPNCGHKLIGCVKDDGMGTREVHFECLKCGKCGAEECD